MREDIDLTRYLQEGLFVAVPNRRRFRLFGERCMPAPVVDSARILFASIGLTAGAEWPERTLELLVVAPGFEVMDVVERRAAQVQARMSEEKSVAPNYRVWLVAAISEPMISRVSWVTKSFASALCGVSFFDGAAFALRRAGSHEIVKAWTQGIRDVWASALDAGLEIDAEHPFTDYSSWLSVVDGLLLSYERRLLEQEGKRSLSLPWRSLEQAWRLEVYRIQLMGVGNISWRDAPATSRHRGVL